MAHTLLMLAVTDRDDKRLGSDTKKTRRVAVCLWGTLQYRLEGSVLTLASDIQP